jgi:hypothetical protein
MNPNLITGMTAFGELTHAGLQVEMSKTAQSGDARRAQPDFLAELQARFLSAVVRASKACRRFQTICRN